MSRRLRVTVLLLLSLFFLVAVTGTAIHEIRAPRTVAEWNAAVSTSSLRIHLNTATEEELCLLPGVGPVIAQRILNYRSTVGSFRSLEELLEISGISETLLASWEPYLVV